MLNLEDYGDKVMVRLTATRDLNLASFMGTAAPGSPTYARHFT